MIGAWRFDGSCASGTRFAAWPFAGIHWVAPAGLFVCTQSKANRLSRYCVVQAIGFADQAPSRPLVTVSRAVALAALVLPAEALLLDAGRRRARARRTWPGRAAPCALPKVWPPAISATVSSSFIAMRPKVSRMSFAAASGSGLPFGPSGIHVDQAHLHGRQRLLQLAVAAVALVGEELLLGAPVDQVGLPVVRAPAGEAEGLEAHRLQRDVAGQHHQVGPGELLAVLLLDRPQQPPRLVEVGVVGPAVERLEALLAAAGAAAAVGHAVGAGAVPGHADEERAVVAVVGRPPVLRRGQHLPDVLLDGLAGRGWRTPWRSRSPRPAGWTRRRAGAAATGRAGRATRTGWACGSAPAASAVDGTSGSAATTAQAISEAFFRLLCMALLLDQAGRSVRLGS